MQIVSITRTVPYDGIPHAGGEYALRHARALDDLGHRVTFVAPDTAENRRASAAGSHRGDVLLYGDERVETPGLVERLRRRLSPARIAPRERRAFAADAAVREALAHAEVVEFHWTQAGDLAPAALAAAGRDARTLLVLHDVMTQQVERQLRSGDGGAALRAWRAAKLSLVRRAERRAIAAVDVAVVFSEKDAEMATALAPETTEVAVLRPPLATDGMTDAEAPRDADSRFEVLLVGWFRRADNAQAAEWLCRDVWPAVRTARPHAHLTLAGADPTPALRAAADADPTIDVTGYQQSLDPAYRRADLAVVPVQQGAGVKFKTVVAMLWGIPVVSTSVGVEGVTDDPALIWRIADTAPDFADAIVAAIDDPGAAREVATAGRRWARTEFSPDTFRTRLRDVLSRSPRH